MRNPITFVLAVLAVLLASAPARAGVEAFQPSAKTCSVDAGRAKPWAVNFGAPPPSRRRPACASRTPMSQATSARRVVAFEYSEGYKTRAKIHKIASVATLPLFAATW